VQAVYGVATPFSGVTQIAVGGSAFGYMCAIITDNSVWCWGSSLFPSLLITGHNLVGQLGVGDTTQRIQPTKITQTYVGQTLTLQSDAFTALSLIMGPYDRYTYMCAIRMDRTLWCWGKMLYSQVSISRLQHSRQSWYW
jgi:alpha-tubulin suppressor-like RCC1 family protein